MTLKHIFEAGIIVLSIVAAAVWLWRRICNSIKRRHKLSDLVCAGCPGSQASQRGPKDRQP